MAIGLTKTATIDEMMQKYEELKAGGTVGPVGSVGPPGVIGRAHGPSKFNIYDNRPSLISMIASRLRQREGECMPFDTLHAHEVNPERFIVFVVAGGEPVVLEDGALFPSDKLITQLRLLGNPGGNR